MVCSKVRSGIASNLIGLSDSVTHCDCHRQVVTSECASLPFNLYFCDAPVNKNGNCLSYSTVYKLIFLKACLMHKILTFYQNIACFKIPYPVSRFPWATAKTQSSDSDRHPG